MNEQSKQMQALAEIVAPKGAALSPERERLAEANARVVELDAQVRAAEAAVITAEGLVRAAETRSEEAGEALSAARAAQTDRIKAAAIEGQTPANDGALRAARLDLADAEDELEAARSALATLREPVADLKRSLGFAESAAADARGVVLRQSVPDLVRRLYGAAEALLPLALAIGHITHNDPSNAYSEEGRAIRDRANSVTSPTLGLLQELHRYATWDKVPNGLNPAVPAHSDWLAYSAALTSDATALPPG